MTSISDVMVSWLPCFHDYAAGGLDYPRCSSAGVVKVTTGFPALMLLWAKPSDKYQGTTVRPISPTRCRRGCARQAKPRRFSDLSHLTLALSGASPSNLPTSRT